MVTKKEVDEAKAAAVEANAAADTAADVASTAATASYGAWSKYAKLKREFEAKMVTEEDVEKAKAEWMAVYDYSYSSWKTALTADVFLETAVAAYVAYDRYLKLRQEYENGN